MNISKHKFRLYITRPSKKISEMDATEIKLLITHAQSMSSGSKAIKDDNGQEYWENMDEAADYIHAKRSTLYKLTAAGEIAYHKSGKKNVFRIADLDRYLASRRKSSIEEIKEKANSRRS